MKYRYLILDTLDGCHQGTNALQTALDFSVSEDFFVLDVVTGEMLTTDGERIAAKNLDEGDAT